ILLELLVGFVQVGVFAFVFPGEIATLPHVGPALPATELVGTGFEGEARAAGIVLGGCGMADQAAKVDEMFLGSGALFERGIAPLGDKSLGGDRYGHGVSGLGSLTIGLSRGDGKYSGEWVRVQDA